MRERRSVWKYFVIFNILTRLLNHRKWGKCHFSKGLWRRRRKLASRTGLHWGNSCTLQCVKYSVCDLRFAVLQCVLYSVCLVFRVQWSPQCELQHLATSCCSKNMICAKLIAMNEAHICAVNNVQFNVQWGNTTSIAKHSLLPSKNTLLPQNLRVRCEAGVLCTLNILGNQCEVSQPVWHSAQLHTECAVSHADFIVASNAVKWKVGGGARCITATRLNGCTAGCTAGGAECPLQSAREATYTAAAQQMCAGCHCALHWLQVAVTSAVASDDAQQWVAS